MLQVEVCPTEYVPGDKNYHGIDISETVRFYTAAQFLLRLSYRLWRDTSLSFDTRWAAYLQLHALAGEASAWTLL